MKSLMHSTSSSILLPLSPSLPLPLSLQTHPPCIRLLAFCFQLIFWLFSHLSAAFTPLLSKCPLWLIFRLFTLFVISFPKLFHFSAGLFFKKNQSYPQIVFNLGWYLSVLLSLDLYPCISKEEDGLQLSQNIDIDWSYKHIWLWVTES